MLSMDSGLKELVNRLKSQGLIDSKGYEQAFLNVPREKFFPKESKDFAFVDLAYSVGENSTISQPTTIATMLSLLEVMYGDKVLEVGSGSGYVLALLNKITNTKVYGIEINQKLADNSNKILAGINIDFEIQCSDAKKGFKKQKNFDRILVSAATKKVPDKLFDQLSKNGLLIAPVGDEVQDLMVFNKNKDLLFRLGSFVFVKMT